MGAHKAESDCITLLTDGQNLNIHIANCIISKADI